MTHDVREREQAPRTPNASRQARAKLGLGRLEARGDCPDPVKGGRRICHRERPNTVGRGNAVSASRHNLPIGGGLSEVGLREQIVLSAKASLHHECKCPIPVIGYAQNAIGLAANS